MKENIDLFSHVLWSWSELEFLPTIVTQDWVDFHATECIAWPSNQTPLTLPEVSLSFPWNCQQMNMEFSSAKKTSASSALNYCPSRSIMLNNNSKIQGMKWIFVFCPYYKWQLSSFFTFRIQAQVLKLSRNQAMKQTSHSKVRRSIVFPFHVCFSNSDYTFQKHCSCFDLLSCYLGGEIFPSTPFL